MTYIIVILGLIGLGIGTLIAWGSLTNDKLPW